MVEFRFNEHRSLPQEIIDQMAAQEEYEQFDLRAVHCFLIRESDSHFVMSHADFHKVRLLEDNLWSKYLQERRVEVCNTTLLFIIGVV